MLLYSNFTEKLQLPISSRPIARRAGELSIVDSPGCGIRIAWGVYRGSRGLRQHCQIIYATHFELLSLLIRPFTQFNHKTVLSIQGENLKS